MSIQTHPGDAGPDFLQQKIAERLDVCGPGVDVRRDLNHRFPHPHDGRYVLGAGPLSPLLGPPQQQRLQSRAFSHVEGAHPFGPVYLVPGQGQQIHGQIRSIAGCPEPTPSVCIRMPRSRANAYLPNGLQVPTIVAIEISTVSTRMASRTASAGNRPVRLGRETVNLPLSLRAAINTAWC